MFAMKTVGFLREHNQQMEQGDRISPEFYPNMILTWWWKSSWEKPNHDAPFVDCAHEKKTISLHGEHNKESSTIGEWCYVQALSQYEINLVMKNIMGKKATSGV